MSGRPAASRGETVLRQSSSTFYWASRLLPRRARGGVAAIYAWSRICDDTVDRQRFGRGQRPASDPAEAARALARIRRLTDEALAGVDGDPIFAGLARAVRDHEIPVRLPQRFLDALAMDVAGRRYPGLVELEDYCDHVAGALGEMLAYVVGRPEPGRLALARNLCVAFQLTNIARDVMDDAQAGRLYLPLSWLEEAGIPPDRVNDPAHRAALTRVVARLLDEADLRYQEADRQLAALPFRLAWATGAARAMYAEIGTMVRRRGEAAWDRRATVPVGRRLFLVGTGLVAALAAHGRRPRIR